MRVFQTLGRLRREYGSAAAHGSQGIYIHGSAFFGQTSKQLARGLPPGQLNGQRGDNRSIVQAFANLEHVGTSGRIAVPNCTLGGSGATPFRQVGEVQVVPAHRYGIQH